MADAKKGQMREGGITVLQVNGKLIYFLLALLVSITGYTGNSIVQNQKEMGKEMGLIKESISCLKSDTLLYKELHEYQHKVLNERVPSVLPR